MLTLDKIATVINGALDKMKTPAEVLPPILLECIAIARPGASASRAAAQAIANLTLLDIPNDINPDGSPNMINQYTYNIIKCVLDEIKERAVVQVSIPAGSIMVQTQGANAGGPLVGVGTNIISMIAKGIIR